MVRWIMRSAECGVRSAECGVRSAECGVWKMRSVENVECGKCGVQKMRSVENAECGNCVNIPFQFFIPMRKNSVGQLECYKNAMHHCIF